MRNLNKEDIKQGHFYVRAGDENSEYPWIREIVSMNDRDHTVQWEMYGVYNNEYLGNGVCSVVHMTKWAGREATSDDISKLNLQLVRDKAASDHNELLCKILDTIPTKTLIFELHLRGYKVDSLVEQAEALE